MLVLLLMLFKNDHANKYVVLGRLPDSSQEAWIISTWIQPSWLCSTCSCPSWKRRWEKGWVSSIIWQYSGMLRSVYSNLRRRLESSKCHNYWTVSTRIWSHYSCWKRRFIFPIDTELPPGRLDCALISLWGHQISQVDMDIAHSVTTALVFWLLILFKIKLVRT